MQIILLTYINRSGSTYLASELGKSPDVLACPEADCLFDFLLVRPDSYLTQPAKKKVATLFFEDLKFKYWNINDKLPSIDFNQKGFDIFYSIIDAYRMQTKPGANKVIFKAEGLFHSLSDKTKSRILWEKCVIINLVRDVRAIYNSQRNTKIPENNRIMSRNVFKTCLYWNMYVRKAILAGPKNGYIIFYESILREYPQKITELAVLLNIKVPVFEGKTDLYERLAPKHKNIHQKIIHPVEVYRAQAWEKELPESVKLQIEIISGKYLNLLGYSVDRKKVSVIAILLLCFNYIRYLAFRSYRICCKLYSKIRYVF